jgi:AcrR family transcriptional regulator
MSSTETRPSGRPRLFDEEAVLDELTALFLRRGYSQTSMADMVDASGVFKSSLYSTFGTKEELFATILRRYLETRVEMFSSRIKHAGPGVDGIHTFLDLLREDLISGASQQGCLLINSSTELDGTTPSFNDFAAEYRSALRQRLRVLSSKTDADGGPSEVLIQQRTELLLTFMLGIGVTVKAGGDETEIRRAIDAMHTTVQTWQT